MVTVLSSPAKVQDVLELAPEWEQLLRSWDQPQSPGAAEFLNRVGARALFRKALALSDKRDRFVKLLRDSYYQPLLQKMLLSNQNMRRFLSQRRLALDEQRSQVISCSVDMAAKLELALVKHLETGEEDGFKVLLPAYIQRSVHNAVVDYIRAESAWERQTLQDVSLDGEQEDPRNVVADEIAFSPEQQVLSGEQVGQLNQLRRALKAMLADKTVPREPLFVVDCMFGLGLTDKSTGGQELTMRETCDRLDIQAETLARRIARCQVLLDKGLDLIRQKIYKDLPGIADCWQRGLNVNTASRRELAQQLGLTEGEIERLIKARQFNLLDELLDRQVIKQARLKELIDKGAAAAFVPVDINSATSRDIMDILGVAKEIAQKICSERPFKETRELLVKNLVAKEAWETMKRRGAVVRSKGIDGKRIDLNKSTPEEIGAAGVSSKISELILKLRPFLTWSEVEDFLGPECPELSVLRQKFFLGLASG